MGMQGKVDELGAEGKGGRDGNAMKARRIGGCRKGGGEG